MRCIAAPVAVGTKTTDMRRSLGQIILTLGLAGFACPLAAQTAAPTPTALPASVTLNQALARLGKNPRDVDALIQAGYAALAMGDVDAAVGFFARADQILPNSPRVRAGLAGALVHSGNPYDAIPLFTEAEAQGTLDPTLYAERGLAYDLVGDNATAQKYYRLALALGANDEASRRMALSLAIGGDAIGMERALAPQLARGDKSAQRVRAFALAILGRSDDAVAIAYQAMPKDVAAGISPYLRYMPRLTRAQQASAANFGTFPRAADIGRDDPRVAKFAPPARVQTADAGLVPKGDPLGAKGKSKDRGKAKGKDTAVLAAAAPVRTAPPELQPRREESNTPGTLVAGPAPAATAPATSARSPVLAVALPPPPPPLPIKAATMPLPGTGTGLAASTFDLATVGKPATAGTSPPTPTPTPTPPPPTPPPVLPPAAPPPSAPPPAAKAPNFADAFGDLGAPAASKNPAPGAVDVRKLAAAKPATKADPPTKPAHPSRIWIQVGTGRDKASLGFTWRGLVKDDPELFKGRSPAIADWGKTNRLLTGPFETEAAANAFFAKLRKAKVDGFVWTSPAGQVVDPLSAR